MSPNSLEKNQSALSSLDRLRYFLRPAGLGLASPIALELADRLLKHLYSDDEAETLGSAWENSLQRVRRVSRVLMGYPSDAGSGVFHGANFGPIAIRQAYTDQFHHYPKEVLDAGDLFCVPELQTDRWLSAETLEKCQRVRYPHTREKLPVSPLSCLSASLLALHEMNSQARVILLGGDQSLAGAAITHFADLHGPDLGVLHIDGQADLRETRHGLSETNSSWAFSVAQNFGRRMVQFGLEDLTKPREYWNAELGILQVWGDEVQADGLSAISRVADWFEKAGVRRLYVTLDMRAVNVSQAAGSGLPPGVIVRLIRELGAQFPLVGADLGEATPQLSSQGDFVSDRVSLSAAQILGVLFEVTAKGSY